MKLYDYFENDILISSAYFPPVSYLEAIVNSKSVVIEQYENYRKQTYRNRCRIYAANGILALSVPVELATNKKILLKDVRVDYREAWQKQHFKSIESAYRNSPFYDYLIDDFMPFFTREIPFLLDLNMGILYAILDMIQLNKELKISSEFEHQPSNKIDLRNFYSPKKEDFSLTENKEYPQVFSDKFGFMPDLSSLDLIFNLGPETWSYLIGKY